MPELPLEILQQGRALRYEGQESPNELSLELPAVRWHSGTAYMCHSLYLTGQELQLSTGICTVHANLNGTLIMYQHEVDDVAHVLQPPMPKRVGICN